MSLVQSVKNLARSLGINIENLSKRQIVRELDKKKEGNSTINFPYPVPPFSNRPIYRDRNEFWLVDVDPKRKVDTFNLINILDEPKFGKGSIFNIAPDFWAWLCELNKYNIAGSEWAKLLIHPDNTKFFLSARKDKKGNITQYYIPANGCFGMNKVRVIDHTKNFKRVEAINPYNLPRITDELRQDGALIHVYCSGKGWHPNYPILWPVLAPYGEAWIESRLFKDG